MKNIAIIIALAFLLTGIVSAEEKRHGPKAVEVVVTVGTSDEKLVFVPNHFTFERGKYYKLVINNPSSADHYFSSDAFATHIFTRKVEVVGNDGKTIAEIHGAIHDMEIKPGTTVEWYFYPMTNGKGLKLYCHKNDHEQHGMVGTIDIIGPAPFSQ